LALGLTLHATTNGYLVKNDFGTVLVSGYEINKSE